MDHEAYEKQMIDHVNRNSAKKSLKNEVITNADRMALKIGFKRTLLALLTTLIFALSLAGFVMTAIVQGYLAVVTFMASIVVLMFAISLLGAQGISRTVNRGESK